MPEEEELGKKNKGNFFNKFALVIFGIMTGIGTTLYLAERDRIEDVLKKSRKSLEFYLQDKEKIKAEIKDGIKKEIEGVESLKERKRNLEEEIRKSKRRLDNLDLFGNKNCYKELPLEEYLLQGEELRNVKIRESNIRYIQGETFIDKEYSIRYNNDAIYNIKLKGAKDVRKEKIDERIKKTSEGVLFTNGKDTLIGISMIQQIDKNSPLLTKNLDPYISKIFEFFSLYQERTCTEIITRKKFKYLAYIRIKIFSKKRG